MREPELMYSEKEHAAFRLKMSAMFDIKVFTCDDCFNRFSCMCAFDPYNQDDDCLMEK